MKRIIEKLLYHWNWFFKIGWTLVDTDIWQNEHESSLIPDEIETWRNNETGEQRTRIIYR